MLAVDSQNIATCKHIFLQLAFRKSIRNVRTWENRGKSMLLRFRRGMRLVLGVVFFWHVFDARVVAIGGSNA
jgi:hypothetical protein